jgi:hypothetical protein
VRTALLRRWSAPAVLAIVTFGASLTVFSAGSSATAGSNGAHVSPPLVGAVTESETTWATVLAGRNDRAHDLFWQLLRYSLDEKKWSLVTPPGVADNGGLMISAGTSSSQLLVGFGASQGLDFSPLALTSSNGKNWSPGGLTSRLTISPSAVALGVGGRALALTVDHDGTVMRRSGTLTSWTPLTSERQLAATTGGVTCGVNGLTGVALAGGSVSMVGTSCARAGEVGLFTNRGGWKLMPVAVPPTLASSRLTLIRLDGGAAMFAAMSSAGVSLVASWASSATWSMSRVLHLAPNDRVLAAGTGPHAAQFVVIGSGTSERAEIVTGPGTPWTGVPELPTGTATIAYEPDGTIDALAVDGAHFTSWRIDPRDDRWTEAQSSTIPIVYGSSG